MDASLPTGLPAPLAASHKKFWETWASYDKAGSPPSDAPSDGSTAFHSSVHSTPSSRTRRRRLDTDIPTTVDGSPSTRSMNAPPRLSIVNAPATWRGSSEATYTSISASVTSLEKVTD